MLSDLIADRPPHNLLSALARKQIEMQIATDKQAPIPIIKFNMYKSAIANWIRVHTKTNHQRGRGALSPVAQLVEPLIARARTDKELRLGPMCKDALGDYLAII